MKYSIFTHVPWPEKTDPAKLLTYAADEVKLAEDLGFSSAWIAEHHFTRYGIGSSALVIASYMAGQTEEDQARHRSTDPHAPQCDQAGRGRGHAGRHERGTP